MKVSRCLIILFVIFISACKQNDDFADLKQFIDDVKREVQPQVAQLPEFKLHKPQQYQAVNMRNPFESPKVAVASKAKHPLEEVAISKLQLKGVIAKENQYWAVIQIPGGPTLEVGVGAKIGTNHGIITTISRHEVKVTENLVTDGKKQHRDVVMKVLKEI